MTTMTTLGHGGGGVSAISSFYEMLMLSWTAIIRDFIYLTNLCIEKFLLQTVQRVSRADATAITPDRHWHTF